MTRPNRAISRLEDSDYDGHSLSMLSRIARALQKKMTIVVTANDAETGMGSTPILTS
jgi:hypothetical protein